MCLRWGLLPQRTNRLWDPPSLMRSTDSGRLPLNNSHHLGGQKGTPATYLFITRVITFPRYWRASVRTGLMIVCRSVEAGDKLQEPPAWEGGPGPDHVANQNKTPVKVFNHLPLLGLSNHFSSLRHKTSSQQSCVHAHILFLESRCLVTEVLIRRLSGDHRIR